MAEYEGTYDEADADKAVEPEPVKVDPDGSFEYSTAPGSSATKTVLSSTSGSISGSISGPYYPPGTTFGSTTTIPDFNLDPQPDPDMTFDGKLIIANDSEIGCVTAHISGSKIVTGRGEDASSAVENLAENIAALLDFTEGANNGSRPYLHHEFAEEVSQVKEWAKELGIFIP